MNAVLGNLHSPDSKFQGFGQTALPESGLKLPDIDPVVHQPVRLAILSVLAGCGVTEFLFLEDSTGLSWESAPFSSRNSRKRAPSRSGKRLLERRLEPRRR